MSIFLSTMTHLDLTPFVAELEAHCARLGISPGTFCNRTIGYTYALPRMIAAVARINRRMDTLREAMAADGQEPAPAAPALAPSASIRFDLPVPPSTNHLYGPGQKRGSRHQTKEVRAWYDEAKTEIMVQRVKLTTKALPPGPYATRIRLSARDPADVDNRAKSILDVLKWMQVTPDDKLCGLLSVGRSAAVPPGRAIVTVRSI